MSVTFFGNGEVSEIWLTFPDPQMKKQRKRLTSATFLDNYRKVLTNNELIHLKSGYDKKTKDVLYYDGHRSPISRLRVRYLKEILKSKSQKEEIKK